LLRSIIVAERLQPFLAGSLRALLAEIGCDVSPTDIDRLAAETDEDRIHRTLRDGLVRRTVDSARMERMTAAAPQV
jgi:hypothetical protein